MDKPSSILEPDACLSLNASRPTAPTSTEKHSGCVLKKSLWKYTHLADERCQNGCCLDKQRLLLVSLVLLAVCGMVLLLLWNYQCFIVNHMCQDPERSSEYVLFDMDEQRLSSYGPA